MVAKKDDWKIEDAKRLSHSKLWDIQRNYFNTKGLDAWKGEVPFYVSSNCFIANVYANLVFRLIQQAHLASPSHPLSFQIIELGAGTGKFSFYFIKFFLELLKASELSVNFCYTLTDFSEKIISSIQDNHSFTELKKQLAANQTIECTVWDFETAQKSIVKPGHTPIIIANYVFDCIKQDKFNIDNGVLHEVQVALTNRYLKFDPLAPKTLKDIEFKESNVAVDPNTYYEDSKLNAVLKNYIATMKTGTEFCMPVGAFNFISLLDDTQPYYLLVGDKGLSRTEDFEATQRRELMSYDGCYSFLLNFNALKQYFEQLGGEYIGTDYVYTFGVHLYGNRLAKKTVHAVKNDFNEIATRFGPKEYLSICQEFQGSCYRFKLDTIIDFIKLSNYDPDAYGIVHDRLIEQLPLVNDFNKPNILWTMNQVENNIYVLGTAFDTYNLLGIFYQLIGDLEKAEELFNKSINILGPSGPTYHNLGILHTLKKDKAAAIQYFEKSLQIEEKNSVAKRRLMILKGSFWSRIIIPLSKFAMIIAVITLMYLYVRYG